MKDLSNKYRGYSLFSEKLDTIDNTDQILINTINQYSFCVAEEDEEFKQALTGSDILLPDGEGIVFALKATTGKLIKKISGAELHSHFLQKLNREHGKCFYLGSSENTLSKIRARIATEFPNISFATFSPPYKAQFSEAENEEMIEKVNEFQPDVLFIGMTAPKQEKWAFTNRWKIKTKAICSIGAVFDFYAGTVPRPSQFWIDLKLEWFVRLVKEPKRMWKRYLYYGPIFVYNIISEQFKADLAHAQLIKGSDEQLLG